MADCLDCYACGLSSVDPLEMEGSVYNSDPEDPMGKMYNETCSSFATFQVEFPEAMSKWVRSCPPDVKSCFWATGGLNEESKKAQCVILSFSLPEAFREPLKCISGAYLELKRRLLEAYWEPTWSL